MTYHHMTAEKMISYDECVYIYIDTYQHNQKMNLHHLNTAQYDNHQKIRYRIIYI